MRREAGEATGTGKSAGAWDAIAALVGMGAVAAVVYADALRSWGARVVGSTDTETYAFLWGFHWGCDSLLGDDHANTGASLLLSLGMLAGLRRCALAAR